MKIPCGTILDLIPLVKDGVASKESVQLVQDHIQTCDRCRIDYEAFENLVQESSASRMRRSWLLQAEPLYQPYHPIIGWRYRGRCPIQLHGYVLQSDDHAHHRRCFLYHFKKEMVHRPFGHFSSGHHLADPCWIHQLWLPSGRLL